MPVGVQVAAVVLLALAMVSSFPYAKLARLLRLPPWLLVVPVVGAMIDIRMTVRRWSCWRTWSAARCSGCAGPRQSGLTPSRRPAEPA